MREARGFATRAARRSRGAILAAALAALAPLAASGQTIGWQALSSNGLEPGDLIFRDGFESGDLACDAPADGALVDVTPGADVVVSGTAVGFTDVRVNGAPVAVATDGTFSTIITGRYGLNFVELSGMDGGRLHTGLCTFLGSEHWLAEGARNRDAVAFRLEPPGVQKLNSYLPSWFAGPRPAATLNAALLAANPLKPMGGSSAFQTEVTHQSLSINVDFVNISVPDQQTVHVQVQLDVRFQLRVRARRFGIITTIHDGEVLFNNGSGDIDVRFGIDLATSRIYAVPGVSNLQAGQISTQGFNDPDVAQMMASWAATDFPDIVFGHFAPILANGAAGLFVGLFEGMDTTVTGTGFPVGRLDGNGSVTVALDILGWNGVDTGACVQWADAGLNLCTALTVTSPPTLPGANGRIPMPPPFDTFMGTAAGDARAVVHAGVFNQVLQALWRTGLFDGTVSGESLDPALPNGTSVEVALRAMPVLTGFEADETAGLDVGTLDLLVTHPDLPPGLRVSAGARVRANLSLVADDLVFGDLAVNELHVSTGEVVLGASARVTLDDLVTKLVLKIAGIALNDSLPSLPLNVFTVPASLADYGLTPGAQLRVQDPVLWGLPSTTHVFLVGGFFP